MSLRRNCAAKPRILVLDDDAQRYGALRCLLGAERFQFIEPAAQVGGTAYPVDLVIVGIAAQFCSRTAAALITRLGGSAPVLALVDHAAWNGFGFFDVANALGAAAVLQRPFPRAALLRSIDAVLSQSHAVRMAENSWDLGRSESSEFFLENPRFA